MRFKVIRKTFVHNTLFDIGEEVEINDEDLVVDEDGEVRFDKYPALTPMDKKAAKQAVAAKQKAHAEKAQTDAGLLVDPPAEDEDEDEGEPDGELGEAEKEQAILDALDVLDPEVDAHWTKAGKPDVTAIEEIVGFDVQRKDIDAIAKDFTRPQSE